MTPCNNCGEDKWTAKTDYYCTSCSIEYQQVLKLVYRYEDEGENPLQKYVDKVLEENM